MSLEVVNTVATLTTTVVIAATAVAALAQLRHMRAGNQITGFLTLRAMLDDETHQRAIASLEREGDISHDPDFLACDRAVFAGKPMEGSERTREVRAAVMMVGNAFEVMATLVRSGIVDRRLFLEQYCATIINMWSRLEPYIAVIREIHSDDGLWEGFEYLAVISQAYMAKYPSIYPKGVPRLLPSAVAGPSHKGV